MSNELPSPIASLIKSAFTTAAEFETSLKAFVKNAGDYSLPLSVANCSARAENILNWNGQNGALVEVLFDDLGFVGSAVVQTGHNLEDSFFRAATDERIEPKPYRTSPGYWKPNAARSQFIWLQKDHAESPHATSGLGYGFWINRQEASSKLIGKIATDASLSAVREWRRILEIRAIAKQLSAQLNSDVLRQEVQATARRIDEQSKERAEMDARLVKTQAAERTLAAAAAKYAGLIALVGLAAAIASLVAELRESVDASTRAAVAGAGSPEELKKTLQSERQLLQNEREMMQKRLKSVLSDLDKDVQSILEQAKHQGAPSTILKQPLWHEDHGQPTLYFPKP